MREFLKGLDFDKETIDTIMAEHGKHLTGHKERSETLSKQLAEMQDKLKGFGDISPEDAKRLSGEIAALKESHAAELAKRDRAAETDKFMSGYKFVNDETRGHYAEKLDSALDDDANKGKTRKDILDSLVNGEDGKPRANIFADEKAAPPPPYAPGTGTAPLLDTPEAVKQKKIYDYLGVKTGGN